MKMRLNACATFVDARRDDHFKAFASASAFSASNVRLVVAVQLCHGYPSTPIKCDVFSNCFKLLCALAKLVTEYEMCTVSSLDTWANRASRSGTRTG